MKHFVIISWGPSFDDHSFLAGLGLKNLEQWTQGGVNGIRIILSEKEALALYDQEIIAVDYLRENREALRRIVADQGVHKIVLRLEVNMEIPSETNGFGINVSDSLMWHVLDTGLKLMYHIVVRNDTTDLNTE